MATITKGRTFVSGEVVTPSKLNTLVDSATISGIVDADVSVSASIVDTKLATISTPGKVSGAAITSGNITTSGNISSSGTVTASSFIGSGASLTGIVGIPSGAVMPFAMNSAPTGWLAANGSAVSRTTYATLFAAIGVTYGTGDGSTTFTLPDLRGYFVRGAGTNSDATASGTFGAKQANSIVDHTHNDSTYSFTGGAVVTNAYQVYSSGNALTSVTGTSPARAVNAPNNGGTETRPNNIAMLYCVKT